jgi:hypothetical protein
MVAEAGLDPTLAYWTGDEDAFVRKLGAGWSPGVVAIAAGVVGRAAQVHDLGQLLAFADHELAPDHESATAEHQHAAGQL